MVMIEMLWQWELWTWKWIWIRLQMYRKQKNFGLMRGFACFCRYSKGGHHFYTIGPLKVEAAIFSKTLFVQNIRQTTQIFSSRSFPWRRTSHWHEDSCFLRNRTWSPVWQGLHWGGPARWCCLHHHLLHCHRHLYPPHHQVDDKTGDEIVDDARLSEQVGLRDVIKKILWLFHNNSFYCNQLVDILEHLFASTFGISPYQALTI